MSYCNCDDGCIMCMCSCDYENDDYGSYITGDICDFCYNKLSPEQKIKERNKEQIRYICSYIREIQRARSRPEKIRQILDLFKYLLRNIDFLKLYPVVVKTVFNKLDAFILEEPDTFSSIHSEFKKEFATKKA